MSRSNPNENSTPNPATCWFEWNGEHGHVRYYDKDAKQNVIVGDDFIFLLLDQLGSVRGWHDASDSGIYSNEVKDTRQEALIVKSFKGGTLAEGIYKDIKDRVNAMGGQFVANCYIAFKNGSNQLVIGSMRFKGASLRAWMDFCRENRADIYKKAIHIKGFEEGKKGRIVFRVPQLFLKSISPETDAAAVELDQQLQDFLTGYFKRTKRDQVDDTSHVTDEEVADQDDSEDDDDRPQFANELTDDDIPF